MVANGINFDYVVTDSDCGPPVLCQLRNNNFSTREGTTVSRHNVKSNREGTICRGGSQESNKNIIEINQYQVWL